MGFRFYRRIRVLPGLRLNLSKTGISTSIGRRGAWLTFSRKGTRATVGLPGTGLSYTTTSKTHHDAPRTDAPEPAPEAVSRPSVVRGWLWIALLVVCALAWWALGP